MLVLEKVHLLELAAQEMEGRGIVHCHSGHAFDPQCTSVEADETGGRCFVVDAHLPHLQCCGCWMLASVDKTKLVE